MNILHIYGGTSKVYEVELTPEEQLLSDSGLIDLADAGGDPERAKVVYNFGGTVTRLPEGKARITVYID